MRKYTNRPPHLYLKETYYFITARTRDSKSYFNSNKKKNTLSRVLQKACKKFEVKIFAWVILDNHYHLLIKLKKGKNLSKFIGKLHRDSARLINILDGSPGRSIWWNYWDHCIRNEKDFWTHFNYIHHNPVKHSYVNEMKDWQFSSFNYYLRKYGEEWIASCFEKYPIIDFTIERDK